MKKWSIFVRYTTSLRISLPGLWVPWSWLLVPIAKHQILLPGMLGNLFLYHANLFKIVSLVELRNKRESLVRKRPALAGLYLTGQTVSAETARIWPHLQDVVTKGSALGLVLVQRDAPCTLVRGALPWSGVQWSHFIFNPFVRVFIPLTQFSMLDACDLGRTAHSVSLLWADCQRTATPPRRGHEASLPQYSSIRPPPPSRPA